ncbi:hypothetical protein ES703_75897 [subsurface metagenome]
MDDRFCDFFHRQVHRGVIDTGSDQKIEFFNEAVVITFVMMYERAARRSDDADTFGRLFGRDIADFLGGYLGVFNQLFKFFSGIHNLNCSCPMESKCEMCRFAAEDTEELFCRLLSDGRRDSIGYVQTCQRGDAHNTAVRSVLKAVPAYFAKVRHLKVTPGHNVLSHMVEISFRSESVELFAGRVDDTNVTVVESELIVLIDHPHIISFVVEQILVYNDIDQLFVLEDKIINDPESELAEFDKLICHFCDFVAVFF